MGVRIPPDLKEGKVKIKSFNQLKNFVVETWQELKKVTWPTRRETLGATAVVIILVLLTSLYLGLVDMVIQYVISLFYRILG
jgi:preprotein translocase subunit SecE